MATETTKVVLDLDNKEFVKKLKESLGLLGELGKTDSVSDLGKAFVSVGTVAGVAAAAVLAVKTAIDLSEEAEHIKQVNKSFESLAENAGLAADVIKSQLIKATKGLADDTEVLQAANRAIIEMGGNAAKIPETMELARKYTAAFGGELIQNFEGINHALATGSERMLRQYGITVDTDKAQREYAKSLGIGVQFLTDAGKKQAVMNEALEEAKKKFAGVDESISQTTQNMKKMSVSLSEIKEAAILAWDKILGPTVQNATQNLANGFHNLAVQVKAAFGSGEEQAAAQKEVLEHNIEQLKQKMELNKKIGVENDTYTLQLQKLQSQLDKINESEEHSMHLAQMKAAAGQGAPEKAVDVAPQVDYEKLKEARLKFEKELEDIRMKRTEADLQYGTNVEQVEKAFHEQQVTMTKEAELQKDQLRKEGLDKGVITQQQYADAVANIDQTLNDKMKNNNEELNAARIRALDNYQKSATSASAGISAAFRKGSTQAKMDLTNWGKTGGIVFDSVKKRSVEAFKAMGDGSKSAGEAMRGFMFGSIADTAEAKGTEMLLSGLWPPNPIAIAGGGALIALAEALRSQAQGSSKMSGGGGGGGGGAGASAQSTDSASAAEKPQAEAQHKKVVTLNVHGNLYETEQTRTRLMDMIREAGDFTDFNLKQIGQQ